MIVRIGNGGRSFKGMDQYFGHDKGATTKERVAWTHTLNMLTDDPDKAWKVMAYTAMDQKRLKQASGQKSTGTKLQKPVFAYVLSWHPEHQLTEDHIRETALKSLEALDLMDYQVLMYRHRDEPQPHVHIIVNRVHPETGLAARLPKTKERFSEFARLYEREHGKIYCKQREENYQKRKEGEKARYADQNIVEAWNAAADGKSFAEALKKKGYQLANGRKRVVVVDPHGKIINPARHLHGVRAKDIKQKLGHATLASLFDAASLSNQARERQKRDYDARQKGVPATPPAVILNRLQDKHIEERSRLFNQHQSRMEKEQEKLTAYYKIEQRQKEIAALTQKTAQPSLLRRLFGVARRDRKQLEAVQTTYNDAQQRITERVKGLENERQQEMLKLIEKQSVEKSLLYERSSSAVQPVVPQKREKKKSREFDRDI
jgi:hypothetical protein